MPSPDDLAPAPPTAPVQTHSVADAHAATGGAAAAAPCATLPTGTERYALLEEIARGGMGVIFRATDTALGREVAIKVLVERFAPDSSTARRFADEARIAAQLQHPGIPPVHDVGTLPDGQPFLAMKLIKGQVLDQVLDARPDLSAERGRYVAIFEQVCQAIAYAHSRSVIHRDLKPSNIMVGAFGEVQVMDWGLAKVLTARPTEASGAEETAAGTLVVSLRDSDGAFTQAGTVLGTPAFMPPEQAVGALGRVDQRSDVFGLGAILAVILTGKPPFAATSAETTRVKAAQGDVAECLARLDGCGAEPHLVALCKRCLSPKAADRPADAGVVAREVAGLRQAAEERARAAELERVRAELSAAEQRKRRRVQTALAGALGLLFFGVLAFGWWQTQRHALNAEAVTGLLDQCDDALRADDAARAAVTLEAAEKRAAEGGADKKASRLARCRDDLAALRDLEATDRFRWTVTDQGFPDAATAAPRYREALARVGADPDAVGAEAAAARVADSAVRERLVGALDRLLMAQKSAAVRAALRAVDPDPFRDAVRDVVQGSDRAALQTLIAQPEALTQPPGFTAFLGEKGLVDAPDRVRTLLEAALQRRPADLGLLMGLGFSYPIQKSARAEDRARWYQAAVAIAPANPVAHNALGLALFDLMDMEGATAQFQEAVRLDPDFSGAHNSLGMLLHRKQDVAGAIAEYQACLRLNPRNYAAHNNLAWLLHENGDLDGAIAEYRAAIELGPRASVAHANLGGALQARGDLDAAIAEYQLWTELNPGSDKARTCLARARKMRELLPGLADVVAGKNKPKNAAEALALAQLCVEPFQARNAAAARLFAEAFAADPELVQDLKAESRYNAACAAAQAGSGKGKDAASQDEAARARLRGQGLAWLRADLAARRRLLESRETRQAEVTRLAQWLGDPDLASVRPGPSQVAMPVDERAAWAAFWADVKAAITPAQKAAAGK
jgi:Flp pilus assembly protein TadD